jgi:integrase
MPLKDTEIRAAKATDKEVKLYDGLGLYLLVNPSGSKLWKMRYSFGGKERKLSFGRYPEVSLKDAREKRDKARQALAKGDDPGLIRKKAKVAAAFSTANTFEAIAEEYIETKMVREGAAEATITKARWFLGLLKPAIGSMPITEVDPQMLLAPLKKMEARGTLETAKKCRSFSSRVFRYGIWTGRCTVDVARDLQGALTSPKAKNYAAILEPGKFGQLLRAIEDFDGGPITKLALQLSPHIYVRPSELRHAEWSEFDLDEGIWRIPAGKMKARRRHDVPLSRQAVAVLRELEKLTGPDGFVFPAMHTSLRPMSENTVNAALRRMGYSKEEMTAHGFRATASSLLNESGRWHPDAIERSLAHGESNAVRGAYHRGTYWKERVEMAQWWSDYIDQLRVRGNVLTFPKSKRSSS